MSRNREVSSPTGLPELARGARIGPALQEQVGVPGVLGEGPAEGTQEFAQPVPVLASQRALGVADELLGGQPGGVEDALVGALRVPRIPLRNLTGGQRSGRNAARISVANSSGSSQAAKWPPLSTSLK
jgi:hypothetical protein